MAIRAIFADNSQVCLAESRLFVQRGIHDGIVGRFTAEAGQLVVGVSEHSHAFLGPLIEARHREKVHSYVQLAQTDGGEVAAGGTPITHGDLASGFDYPPTIVTELTNDNRTAEKEIFGPFSVTMPFDAAR